MVYSRTQTGAGVALLSGHRQGFMAGRRQEVVLHGLCQDRNLYCIIVLHGLCQDRSLYCMVYVRTEVSIARFISGQLVLHHGVAWFMSGQKLVLHGLYQDSLYCIMVLHGLCQDS